MYYDPSRTPVMVLEKMDTSLRLMLEATPKEEFPLINKVVILRQVAQGLVYLHSHSPKLVHHDLSPNNILVNEVTYVTKLTDFGMIRAIEALHYPLQYNDKLDVFSNGNVIITIIMKAFGGMTMLCLENEGIKRASSTLLLAEVKQIEASLLV